MTPAQSFADLFDSTNMVVTCLWITGFILFCIEFFQPMHGVAYALGLGLLFSAFVTRAIYGTPGVAFMFVLVTAVVLFAVHGVALVTQKRDWLKVARIEKAGERNKRYAGLMDGIGVANTPIDLTGSVTINDVNLVVYSDSPIMQGEHVRITGITQDRITVERVSDPEIER